MNERCPLGKKELHIPLCALALMHTISIPTFYQYPMPDAIGISSTDTYQQYPTTQLHNVHEEDDRVLQPRTAATRSLRAPQPLPTRRVGKSAAAAAVAAAALTAADLTATAAAVVATVTASDVHAAVSIVVAASTAAVGPPVAATVAAIIAAVAAPASGTAAAAVAVAVSATAAAVAASGTPAAIAVAAATVGAAIAVAVAAAKVCAIPRHRPAARRLRDGRQTRLAARRHVVMRPPLLPNAEPSPAQPRAGKVMLRPPHFTRHTRVSRVPGVTGVSGGGSFPPGPCAPICRRTAARAGAGPGAGVGVGVGYGGCLSGRG